MKTIFTYLLALLALVPSFAQGNKQTVPSKIEKVTLFTNAAQVTRKAKTNLSSGKTELVFADISPNLDKQSIQVKGDGKFTILSVSQQLNFLKEQTRRDEVTKLELERQAIWNKRTLENTTFTVFKQEEAILQKNQIVGGANTGLKASDLKEVVDFQRIRMTEVLQRQLESTRLIEKMDSIIQKINAQLKEIHQRKNLVTSEILVTVSSSEATSANFDISYLVQNAGWFANYDLRVQDINSPIDLTFKANVFQSSGEDWKDVKLAISNGNPTESGVAPTLAPWYLRFGQPAYKSYNYYRKTIRNGDVGMSGGRMIKGKVTDGIEPLIGANVMLKGTTFGAATDVDGNYSITLPANRSDNTLVFSYTGYNEQIIGVGSSNTIDAVLKEGAVLDEVVVLGYGQQKKMDITGSVTGLTERDFNAGSSNSRIRGGTSITKSEPTSIALQTKESYQPTTTTFEIEVPYTILNDGKTYTVEVKRLEIPAIYDYFTTPKLEKAAFLTAKIIDWQDLNLIEGEANLFFEGAFLGKSILDTHLADDTLNISLGRDKSIIVERKKLKEYTNKQFLSNNKTDNRAYEIAIRNNKKQTIKITIEDQFPISTTKEISVEKQEAKDSELNETTQKVTWKNDVAPKQEIKHTLKYSVKYPKHQVLVLE